MKAILGVILIVTGIVVLIQLARKRPVSRWAYVVFMVGGVLAIVM